VRKVIGVDRNYIVPEQDVLRHDVITIYTNPFTPYELPSSTTQQTILLGYPMALNHP
jgi:hypothetical protein